MERIVVTGASRGIGLEFCRQFARRGDWVFALARHVELTSELIRLRDELPDLVHVRQLDVTDFAEAKIFAVEISTLPVDILINNAGQIGPETHRGQRGQAFGSIDYNVVRDLFEVNAVAALHLTECMLPSLKLSARARAFVLGSTVGCAAETFGDYHGYRMSKSAAHITFATLGKDLASQNISAGVICPGWVRTEMGGASAPLSAEESVRGMIQVMDSFSESNRGKFLSYDGRELHF
jgi:NAD(P)-dependent dehydrogenase (short-subunit alcohol dehydrogenase family)